VPILFLTCSGRTMSLLKRKCGMNLGELGRYIPTTLEESFVNCVYSSIDEVTTDRLDRLRSEDGIVPSCTVGCSHCCRYHILTNIAEAHTLAQYVKRSFSVSQINDLRLRTQQWHEWDNSRPGRYPSANIGERTDLSSYEHCCPLLVNGACSVYPVRPIACRTHFVSSPPLSCLAVNNPECSKDRPIVLTSIVTDTSPFSMAIRNYIENAGLDFSRSTMLLPHWLAIEMGWDFAISP
jgi:Fe-S-cluster containining protein